MKKVLVLVAALSLFAAPAIAAITGTAHDLGSNGLNGSDEICVFCHTPHGADITVANAPLWNRTNVDATIAYAGLDIQAVYNVTTINQTDAPLCLSCHDGASIAVGLVNEPNTGNTAVTSPATLAGLSTDIGGDAEDLSNDHPIGFDYALVAGGDAGTGSDNEIHDKTTAEGVLGANAISYGAGNDMWCSSCHDVHDNTSAPFLRISNNGSALCLACHIK